MSRAMQQIVDAYLRLKNRQALEDMLMHRQKLLVDLKSRANLIRSSAVDQISEEVTVIEDGLSKFDEDNGRPEVAPNTT